MFRTLAILCLPWLPVVLTGPARAEDVPARAAEQRLRGEVARLLQELDSDRFEVRRRAAAGLEELVAKPQWSRLLSAEFHRVLLRPDLSFEVRWHLKRWCDRLPQLPPKPPEKLALDELDRLMRQLNDDSYAIRLAAARRLEWLLGNPKLICPMMIRLKRLLADPAVDEESRRLLKSTLERARAAWLVSDPAGWDLPPVSQQQIDGWCDELVGSAAGSVQDGPRRTHGAAEQDLLDVLARDEYVPRVQQALQSRLAGQPGAEAAGRLERLLDLTRPAMVAECWQGGRHTGEQHLLVGVPSLGPGANRPSHFDRIDDQTAHCASGNNLSPGDYPVGVAFPHPNSEGAFFHLVNLSTPRRRMAYTYHTQTDEPQRLAALSRRTLDRMLAEKQELAEPELIMLAQLDPKEVSRFAGRYFSVVEDRQLPPPDAGETPVAAHTGGRPSRFGTICRQLAIDGTKEAAPGLLEAIDKGRFLPPDPAAPYRFQWLAALSIAARDPWPAADAWLAGLISRNDVLVEGRPDGPELGATAAGVLLKRYREPPLRFGLRPAPEPLLIRLGIDGYRSGSDEAREKMQQWWEREQEKRKQGTATPGL